MKPDLFWDGTGDPTKNIIKQEIKIPSWNKNLRLNPSGSFPAKFKSVCPGCLNAIEIGEFIEFVHDNVCAHSVKNCIQDANHRLANAPVCFKCKTPMKFQFGSKGAFWGCRNKCKNKEGKLIITTLITKPNDSPVDSSTTIAKINSKCCVCGNWIAKNVDQIKALDKNKGIWVHTKCYQEGIELTEKSPRCPKCNFEMKLLNGKFGPFWSCSKYPNCRGTISFNKTKEIKIGEPEPTQPELEYLERSSETESKPANIIEEYFEEEIESLSPTPPQIELSKSKYSLWLDKEFTQPYTFSREGKEIHAGGNSLEKIQQTVNMIERKTGITVYIKTNE